MSPCSQVDICVVGLIYLSLRIMRLGIILIGTEGGWLSDDDALFTSTWIYFDDVCSANRVVSVDLCFFMILI